jgi:predicted transcriptional regulator of viral defense system
VTASDRLIALLVDYRGMRLTIDDVVDELGISRDFAHTLIGKLVKAGQIERDTIERTVHVWLVAA